MSEQEFTELVAGTKSIVLAAIRRYLNPALVHAIDDVAQETYIRVFRYIQKHGVDAIRADRKKAWIYTIARNESQRLNEGMNRDLRKTQLIATEHHDLLAPSTESLYEIQESLDTDRIDLHLPDDDAAAGELRMILNLRAQGYRIREIASRLKIPEGTIKSRMARLRQRHAAQHETNT